MALVEGTTTRAPARSRKRRKASPVVTEHTRGQAHGGTAEPTNGLPADYGQSNRKGLTSADRRAAQRHAVLYENAHVAPVDVAEGHALTWAGHSARALATLLGINLRAALTPPVGPTSRLRHREDNQADVLNLAVAGALGHQLKTDVTHPLRHPGTTALDLGATVSGAIGVLGRGVEAARAASLANEGEKTAAALGALKTRAIPSNVLPRRLLPDTEGVRKVRLGGGHIQPRESPNILTAAAQHAVDRYSEAHPGAPIVGAAKRIERRLPKERAAAHARVTSEGIPFAVAHKAVSSRRPGRVSAREVAANRLIGYGHEDPANAARLVRDEIRMRRERLHRADITPAERKAQEALIPQLEAALPHVANPSPEVQSLAAEGAKLSGKSTALAVKAGELKPETAAARLDLHPRLIAGAKHVEPTPGRLGQSKALDQAVAYRDRLAATHEKALLRAASKTRPRTAEEAQARLDILDKWYEGKVSEEAKAQSPYLNPAREQAERNRRKPSAKARHPMKTVTQEARDLAEQAIHEAVTAHPDAPFAKLIAERDRLTTSLQQHAEKGTVFEGLTNGSTDLGRVKPNPTGMSSPIVERLGGALSVANDRVQRLEAAVERRKTATGLVGAEDVHAGPGAARVPDVAQQPRLQTLRSRKRGVTGKQQRLVQQSRGVLFTQGRARADTRTILEDYLRSARHQTQAEDIKIAGGFSVPLDKQVGIPEGHVIYNPHGLKVPRALKENPQQLALDQMTPRELAEHLADERRKTFSRVFPKTEADLPDGSKALRTIDKRIADAISGDLSMPSTGAAKAVARIFDTTNNLNKAALIYLKGSYVPLNLAGNVAFLTLHQGPFLLANLKRAAVRLSDLDRETLNRVDTEVGGGAALALAHDVRGGVGGAKLRKLADIEGAAADTLPRRAAWIHEAGVRGFKTPAQIRALLTEKKNSAVLNQVSESARRAMVDFGNLSSNERKILSRAVFIYPWIKGATVYAKDLALDRPIAAAFAQHVRTRIQKYQKEHLGTIDPNLAGLIPVPKGVPWWLGGPGATVKKLGTTTERVVNPAAVTPLGTFSQVAEAAKGAITGNAEQRALPAGFLSPTLAAGVEAATHYNTFTGNAYPKNMSALDILREDLIGTPDRPVIPIASVVKTALSKPQTKPFVGPAAKQASFVKEGGVGAAAKQFFLGSARPRELNLPAAQARGRAAQRASMNPTKRALTSVTDEYAAKLKFLQEKGVYKRKTWEPAYQQAIDRRARRYAAYAKAGTKGQYDRLLVDLQLAVRRGVMSQKDAASDARAYRGAKDKDIENYRGLIRKQDAFGESALSEINSAYTEAGGG